MSKRFNDLFKRTYMRLKTEGYEVTEYQVEKALRGQWEFVRTFMSHKRGYVIILPVIGHFRFNLRTIPSYVRKTTIAICTLRSNLKEEIDLPLTDTYTQEQKNRNIELLQTKLISMEEGIFRIKCIYNEVKLKHPVSYEKLYKYFKNATPDILRILNAIEEEVSANPEKFVLRNR